MQMKCPNCGRRAFDISHIPTAIVSVHLKCPQCNRFVLIPCTAESVRGGDVPQPQTKPLRK